MCEENRAEENREEKLNTIEEKFRRIEEITRRLESGDLTLEESLKEYEQGIRLGREREAQLKDTEKKLKVLTDEGTLDAF